MSIHIYYFDKSRPQDWDKLKGHDDVRDLILNAMWEVQYNLMPEGWPEKVKTPCGCPHQHKKRAPMLGK
jgi:hypothetical protein